MKRTFFSWSAVGMVLAAWCFLSCSVKEGIFIVDPDRNSSTCYRIIDKSKQNLLGKKQGQINPCDIKITSADNLNFNFYCHQFEESGTDVVNTKLFGDGWSLVDYKGYEQQKPILDAHNGRYDFVYYFDLPGGDRDTLIIKVGEVNTDPNKASIYYNGEKSLVFNTPNSYGHIYLIKDNN